MASPRRPQTTVQPPSRESRPGASSTRPERLSPERASLSARFIEPLTEDISLQNSTCPEYPTALDCQAIRQLRFIYITSLLCLTRLNHPSTSFPILEAMLTPYPILTVKPATEMSPKEPLSASPARIITDPIVPSLAA
jgi:hypothetical protein